MSVSRVAAASFVLLVVALIWNGLLHMVVLRDAETILKTIWRADLSDFMWLSVLMTLAVTLLFALGYSVFARTGSLAEGIGYGVFFGLLAGVLVDLNQYILYPIPGRLALYWFLGGLLEFSIYGALITRFFPA